MSDSGETCAREAIACASSSRRGLLRAAAGVALAGLVPPSTLHAAPPAPDKMPPQPGDELAYPAWMENGRLVQASDVIAGAAPLVVYPHDPVSGVTRQGTRLNQILLLKCDPGELDPRTLALAADGILAYSAICTHTACAVSAWDADAGHMLCPCHSAAFDPRQGAAIVSGPAPRPLPALPLRRSGERLMIGGSFSAPPGAIGA